MTDDQLAHQLIHQYIMPEAQNWRMDESRRIERVYDMAALAIVHLRSGKHKLAHKLLYTAIGVSRNTWMKTWLSRHEDYVAILRTMESGARKIDL